MTIKSGDYAERLTGTRRSIGSTAALLACLLALGLAASRADEATKVTLAADGKAALPVIVAADASASVRDHAQTLADTLGRISGAAFEVVKGTGSPGIVIGTAETIKDLPFETAFQGGPFGREDYILRSDRGALWLIGATDLAVQHAVWDLLHRLGYRQYFPGETWEIIPHRPTLALAVNTEETPDFFSRRMKYNWGYQDYNREPYQQWCDRNRMVKGFQLRDRHSYIDIVRRNAQAFEDHPEYKALARGHRWTRVSRNRKFCIANEGLRTLVAEDAVQRIKENPDYDCISMDPSDGGDHCECEDCAALGSVSDRVVLLANTAAEAINALDLGEKYVGMYAYFQHAQPPSIAVHPNVIVSVATKMRKCKLPLEEQIEAWKNQGATMGIYDYFSVVAWDWNKPRRAIGGRPFQLAQRIPAFYNSGARFFTAEAGDAWGPYGLGFYVASRLLWDVGEAGRVQEIIDEFLDNCFGPAREPMADFYELMTIPGRAPAEALPRMYADLAAAREKAAGRPDVLRRLDDLTLYTRYFELRNDFENAAKADRAAARDRLLTHAYRMRERMMIHNLGIWTRMLNKKAANREHPLKSDEPFSPEEINEILNQGLHRKAWDA